MKANMLENTVIFVNTKKEETQLLNLCKRNNIDTYQREKVPYPLFFFFSGKKDDMALYYGTDIESVNEYIHNRCLSEQHYLLSVQELEQRG